MLSEELMAELLAKPVGKEMPKRTLQDADLTNGLTKELELNGNTLTATIVDKPGVANEGTARSFLEVEGLNPDDWEATGFRKSEWGSVDNPMESVRFTFRRASQANVEASLTGEEILSVLSDREQLYWPQKGSYGFLVLVGDMQFGKIDGDGPTGTLRRTLDCIDRAAEAFEKYSLIFDIGHVHIAWLGDHIEGFQSQGGANTWRTQLTLSEQIRLTQAVMLHALKTFAPLAEKVSMAAVPGNHGETVRFQGSGITRYDDSHDTEALIGIAKTIKALEIEGYEHVEFLVPDTDELIVLTEVAGTVVAHHHGHKWRPNKHFEWWQGQAFNRESAMHMADLLVAGHLHHEHIEADGSRTFIGVPAMESDSTWFRHSTGTGGNPGLIVAITKDGQTPIKHLVTQGRE